MSKQRKAMKFFSGVEGKARLFALVIAPILLAVLVTPVYAQVRIPDSTFRIDQVEAYRNCEEFGDQLYLISYTNEHSITPNVAIDTAYIFRLKNSDNITLGTTTAYSYFDSGYDSGIAAIYFSAADAPVWEGSYTVEMAGNPTLHWLDNTAVTAMTGAYADDGGSLTDETAKSNSAAAGDMTLMPAAPAVNDAYYFGASSMFDTLTLNISQQGDWAGTYDWEYWNGSEWVVVSDLSDNSTGFTAGTGNYDITYTCPTNWQQRLVGAISAYWLRFRVVSFTSIATQPLGTQSWTNALPEPPSTQNNGFSLWYDEGDKASTKSRLTTRLRAIATFLENDWGNDTDLIEKVSGTSKLTEDGEDYFVSSIPNLQQICPDLFSDVIGSPEFTEDIVVEDNLMGGEDSSENVTSANISLAQTFTASAEYYINGVWLKLHSVGSPEAMTVSIRDTSSSLPDGSDLVSGTDNASEYTSDSTGDWYEIGFTNHYLLSSGIEYAIVISAISSNSTDYVSWLKDTDNGEANGQSCNSTSGGVTWTALNSGTSDFLFGTTGTDVLSMSLRDRWAQRLIGSRLDMTSIASYFNTTRMWFSGFIWFALCVAITIAVCISMRTIRYATLILAILLPFGAPIGLMYLEIPLIMTTLLAAVSIFVLFHRDVAV